MQLSSNDKKPMQWKCSCRFNGLKCVAACGGCRGTECQNWVTVEQFQEEENNVEDEFDNNTFDNVFDYQYFTIVFSF